MELDRRKAFLYFSALVAGILVFLMVLPFVSYLLTGFLLAFVTKPVFQKLKPRLGKNVSASFIILMTVFAAILPFTIVLGAVGSDAASLVSGINRTEMEPVNRAESIFADYTGRKVDLKQKAGEMVGKVASVLPGSLSSAIDLVTQLSIGVSLMLFAQFYALRDGERLVEWSKRFDFMTDDRQEMLYSSTSSSIWAVVKGHVFMAFAQGVLAGIGFLIFGVPDAFFWTFIMILLGFIPLIGSALIWFPASIYLALSGNVFPGILLALYGVVVVGGADNFLRPLVVDDDADIHPFFIILGLIGGVGLFGPVGVFLGPVLLGVFKNLLDLVQQDH